MESKLEKLAEIEGYSDPMDMLEEYSTECVSPAICKNPDCDNTCEMEPDQDSGWCTECEDNTVVSAFVLAGLL